MLRAFYEPCQSWKQHRSEYGNNRYDYEQFNECEPSLHLLFSFRIVGCLQKFVFLLSYAYIITHNNMFSQELKVINVHNLIN